MNKLKIKTAPASSVTQKSLFIPGYCDNPDDEEPILNIRIFEENEHKVIYGFSRMKTMNAFFLKSNLRSMKYMEIRPPEHVEAARKLELDLIIDPGTPHEVRISPMTAPEAGPGHEVLKESRKLKLPMDVTELLTELTSFMKKLGREL